jgi:hypothetical protein
MSSIVKGFNEVQAIESTPSSGMLPRILFGTDENNHVDEGQEDSKPPAKKKPRRLFDDGKVTASAITTTNTASSESPLTQEQEAILNLKPDCGDIICVNSLAGCGKTTTIALLCNKILEENPSLNILYLVFAKKNQDEAADGGKFPKVNMEIRTTHAYVLRYYFGTANMNSFRPEAEYKLEDIADRLDLVREVGGIFPSLSAAKCTKLVRTIAAYIRKTLNTFQASADDRVEDEHVWWRARKEGATSRTKWRKSVKVKKYVSWAQHFFKTVERKCRNVRDNGANETGITFDGYIKVAQLDGLQINCDVVAIDEAQDMTPCQADLFWGDRNRKDKITYLFGDQWQQLYRFRGASECFKDTMLYSRENMSLTGSFRFGKNIADTASLVLEVLGGAQKLVGRAKHPGKVQDSSDFTRGVVLCRTNVGLMKYLLINRPQRWCFLNEKKKLPQLNRGALDLEKFIRGEESEERRQPFSHKGDIFISVEQLMDYLEDEDDVDLYNQVQLLEFLKEQDKSLTEFHGEIKCSRVPLNKCAAGFYDGVVLATTHSAKGLEFDDVYIHDDFCFKALMDYEDLLSQPRLLDECNLLYVAVTRASKNLFLSEGARLCFEHFSAVAVRRKHVSTKSLRQERETWEERWNRFSQDDSPISTLQDIPWPDENNPFNLDRLMSEEEQRNYLRKMILRFHADKFFPTFRHRLDHYVNDEQLSLIRDNLNELNASAQSIRKVLLGNSSDSPFYK